MSVKARASADSPRRAASNPPREFSSAEFFAGIGLVRLALARAGIGVDFANDIDPDKRDLYVANFGADDFHLGDIHDLDAKEVPACDLFTASFPCNDLSIAGAMRGLNAGQSSAFWGFIDIIRGMKSRKPPLILLENVPGFLMSDDGQDLVKALVALNELGYSVDVVMLDAAHFVPQSRLRLFIVAKRSVGEAKRKVATPSTLRPPSIVDFIMAHPEIRWEIGDLPPLESSRDSLESIIEDLPDDDPAWWNKERAEYFMSQLSDRHLVVAQKMIAGDRSTFGTAFRRVRKGRSMAELRSDGIAGCLRTPRGGSGRQILFKAGKGRYQVRLLTARECARLQGVPDTYRIDTTLNKALFGFGDAVCVPVVEWIAKNYLVPELVRVTTSRDSTVKRRGHVGSRS